MGISHTTNLSEETRQAGVSDAPNGINSTLEDFDVLPSKNRHIFKYGYLYLLISFLLYFIFGASYYTYRCYITYKRKPPECPAVTVNTFLEHIFLFLRFFHDLFTGEAKLNPGSTQIVFLLIGAILFLLSFKIWRVYVPKMLRDLIKNNRISASCGDTATRYQQFLIDYRRALSKPTSYLPGGILLAYALIYMVFLGAQIYHQTIGSTDHGISMEMYLLRTLSLVLLVLFALIEIIFLYSFGTILFAIYITGKYLRKLLKDFQVKSNLTHLDHCGGLKTLGNFYLRLVFLLLVISAFFFAYDIVVIYRIVSKFSDPLLLPLLYRIDFGFMLLFCGVAFFLVIWASVIPLWKIHKQMIDEGEIVQQNQSMELAVLQNQIQNLLDNNQLEEAKAAKEKKELLETLNTPYPRWPFIFFGAISTLLISSATLLLPPIIAAVFPKLLPQLPQMFKHWQW